MKRYEKKIEISNGVECIFQTPLFTGDIGNTIGLEFYLHGKPYKFTMATLFGTDATGDTIYSTSKAEVNEVVLPIVNEMYQVPGKADMQVVLYDDSENAITSAYLHFTVIKGLSENASIEGTEEYNAIMNLLIQVSSSISQINRAEQAANKIESFLQLIKTPENSVIHQITESEIDGFSEGYAIVTAFETEDSEGGPITTEYHYPLIAERVDLFGNVRINQIRLYDGKLQKRTVGMEWKEILSGGSVVDTDALTYKGSKYNITYLPKTGNSVGDVWNLIGKTTITKNVYVAQINSCVYADAIGNTIISTNALPVSSGGVNIYDASMEYICYADIMDNQTLWYQGEMEGWQTFQTGEYYFVFENATYNDTEIPLYTLGENAKVVWTGDEWQPFTGDMSSFATKEDIGNIETALDSIIAIENALIGGDSV